MNLKQTLLFLSLTFTCVGQVCFGQTNACDKMDKEWTHSYSKIFPFYQNNEDSLNYYSDLFSTKFTKYIENNPSTLECKFKMFKDSIGSVVTSQDGLFRIYSWDTWLGGTMHDYENIFQFKSGNKTYTKIFDYGEGDMGTNFTDVYTLKANDKTYYLAIADGSESTKYGYEFIRVYSISGNTVDDNVKLIKTSTGIRNSINFEYDFFSVEDRPESPIHLIKYDAAKKIIYIPIVVGDGKVTDRFILYQFTGQYFEKILTQTKASK